MKKMKKIWVRIKEYMCIEPDPEVARIENFKSGRLILLFGILICILLALLEKWLYGKPHFEAMIGCGIFLFFLSFSFFNWVDLKTHVTGEMEGVILVMLLAVAFVDYFPMVTESAFLFLILLALLPCMLFDKPWRLLLLVLTAGVVAFLFNLRVVDDVVRDQNIIRIVAVTVLGSIFSVYYSHARIHAVRLRQSTQNVAEHDPLTGIYNRAGGIMLIRNSIERKESGTFMIVDIDDFKLVNDNYGHQKGDEILQDVARTLQSSFKQTDIVMRMGGDEFIIYAFGMVDYEVSCKRLELLGEAIRSIIVSEKDGHHVTVSIGGAINDGSYPDYESLYKAADQYLYQTKAKGKDGFLLLGTSYK